MADRVDSYSLCGPTLLHQSCLHKLLGEGLGEEQGGYSRSLCGSMAEHSVSTIEVPDVDINARFHLSSDCIKVKKAEQFGSFLYEIQVYDGRKEEVDEMVLKMQYNGLEEEPQQKEKGLDKSYVVRPEGTFLCSNVARWQLVGVIKSMQSWGLEMSESSRTAAEVGLLNGVYNVMVYDTMVCRRGVLRSRAAQKVWSQRVKQMVGLSQAQKSMVEEMIELSVCFFPHTGIQVDYTSGFHISEEAIPEEAKGWTKRKKAWPSQALVKKVMRRGAHLVPKAFTEEKSKNNNKARRWRINFDLNEIITDGEYSVSVDPRRVLIILKDIKNQILPQSSALVKSYYLKVAIAR